MKKLIRNSTSEFLIFTSQAGEDSIEVRVEDETVWLTQKLMSELFGMDVRTISEHLQNIFKSGELEEDSVIRKFRITASDGKTYNTNYYNLDVIISVGYRINSIRATQFRQWATQVLGEFEIKSYMSEKQHIEYKLGQPRERFGDVRRLKGIIPKPKVPVSIEEMNLFSDYQKDNGVK